MPLVTETETGFSRYLPKNETELREDGPGFLDVVGAAFESENTFANFAANGFELNKQFESVADYNPFDEDIKAVTHHEANVFKNEHNNFETIIIFDI